MKILMVITGLGMGGAEHQVCNLADNLTSRGHSVKIVYLLTPVIVKPKSEKVDLIWLGGNKSLLSIFSAFIHLVKLIKNEKPDVIHSHMFHANILSRLARIFISIPHLIGTTHSNNEGNKPRMLAYRITNSFADIFTGVSKSTIASFEAKKAVPKGKMIAIYNGIDINYFQFNENARQQLRTQYNLQNKKVFIAVGRFHEAKDYPNLLNAFDTLLKTHINIHLLIVGDGELRSTIEQIILERNLSFHITLLGIRKDIPNLLSAADIFVLPSAWEGFGLVVAEAMACKRIVVATDCGGVNEIVGDAGFLVAPKDSNALAVTLDQALQLNSEERENLGKIARSRVIQYYGLDAATEKWLSIYSARS